MHNFKWNFNYESKRMPVIAENVVAASQPLAAQAGIRMLQAGGNAVDAAIAAAITLTVVEPVSNGLGSDAFAIIYDGKELKGINASGRSPGKWSYDYFKSKYDSVPLLGWDAVTVPGAVSLWVELSEKYGKLPFDKLFEDAIYYAESGYLVSPITADAWSRAESRFKDFDEFKRGFLPDGKAPKPGQKFIYKDQADTLKRIASSKGKDFYEGYIAEQIARHSRLDGGLMDVEDLASHKPEWIDVISMDYKGYEVYEIPPNGQGIAALIMLGIIREMDLPGYDVDSADSLHLQIECMKLAFADLKRYIADPDYMDINYKRLLNKDYLKERSRLIDMKKAQDFKHGIPKEGGTVYLTTADNNGMMVSLIQSNYCGFGSGIVVPGTGISMQNRGYGFNMIKDHPNQVDGNKKPFHTIIPSFVMKDGNPIMSYGVMGGPMQTQGHCQMVTRIFDYEQNPQTASDAPRWQVMENNEVIVEKGFSDDVLNELISRGHIIKTADPSNFGGAQLIYKIDGGYVGATDKRKDGLALGY